MGATEAVAMMGEATAAGERAVVARVEARMAAAMAAVATAVGGDGGGVETDARGVGCPRHRMPEAPGARGIGSSGHRMPKVSSTRYLGASGQAGVAMHGGGGSPPSGPSEK